MHRQCKNSPNLFCYICGLFTPKKLAKSITATITDRYERYFHPEKLRDQEKAWAPHIVCSPCCSILARWSIGGNQKFTFRRPCVWREQKNHLDDCYFCGCNIEGVSIKNRKSITYPSVSSVTKPVITNEPVPLAKIQSISSTDCSSTSDDLEPKDEFAAVIDDHSPVLINQDTLDEMVRKMKLTKDNAQYLGSKLKSLNLLEDDTRFAWYRRREERFLPFFNTSFSIAYCSNVAGLLEEMRQPTAPSEWFLFLDGSISSFKAVLIKKADAKCVPLALAKAEKETYSLLDNVLSLIKYEEYNWQVCGDFKIIALISGLQLGYTQYGCFLCQWRSRSKEQYSTLQWPERDESIVGEKNVIRAPLINKDNILLPPLHIKLGLIKSFIKNVGEEKAQDRLHVLFPKLSEAKIKAGVFNGPDCKKILSDKKFRSLLSPLQKEAIDSIAQVFQNFLGSYRCPQYKEIVSKLLKDFENLQINMTLKMHFLQCHLEFFQQDLGRLSDEHGERFHQSIALLERRYIQSRISKNLLADFCWLFLDQ